MHRDRAIAAGVDAAIRFEELAPEERVSAPPAERAAMELRSERAAMVVDDLLALPRSPLVVAEGTVIGASTVDPARAVWLVPTPEFQASHRLDLGWGPDLAEIVEEAAAHGVPTVTVDGIGSIGAVVEEVESLLAGPLNDGPVAAGLEHRRALLREANLAAVKQTEDGCARPWATNVAATLVRSFVCECGDPGCELEVELPTQLAAVEPVMAADHRR